MRGRARASLHRLFGFDLAVEHPLRLPLPPSPAETPQLVVTSVAAPPAWAAGLRRAYESPERTASGAPALTLDEAGERTALRFGVGVDVYLSPGRIQIQLREPGGEGMAEILLLGSVMAFLLERRGVPTLHAAVLERRGSAAAFVSDKGGGKSSLAAALLARGWRLLSDDVLTLEPAAGGFLARPSYPQIRLWQEEAERLVPDPGAFPRVHPDIPKLRIPIEEAGLGELCREPRPLAALYLLDRRRSGDGPEVELAPLPAQQALAVLLDHAFLPRLSRLSGEPRNRFHTLAEAARGLPMRQLRYPSGLDRLPAVAAAIEADLEGAGGVADGRLRAAGEP